MELSSLCLPLWARGVTVGMILLHIKVKESCIIPSKVYKTHSQQKATKECIRVCNLSEGQSDGKWGQPVLECHRQSEDAWSVGLQQAEATLGEGRGIAIDAYFVGPVCLVNTWRGCRQKSSSGFLRVDDDIIDVETDTAGCELIHSRFCFYRVIQEVLLYRRGKLLA